MNFERCSLALVGILVGVLTVAVMFSPPSPRTLSPRVSLAVPELKAAGSPTGVNASSGTLAVAGTDRTTDRLSKVFADIGYELDSVISGGARVPRLFLASLPDDLGKIRESGIRKALFFQTMLPLILQVNEEILADRQRIWNILFNKKLGLRVDAADRLWLSVQYERYGVRSNDIEALLSKVDIVPPSMTLAQAAEESGWGTSRFVREGNAIFGQWTVSETKGLTPLKRDQDKKHKVRIFSDLIGSVRAYAYNLNTHRAYRSLRKTRAARRRKGLPIDGAVLADSLTSYSQRGKAYVATIRSIIAANNLRRLDDARLKNVEPGGRLLAGIEPL